ncbi:MAG: hypothetical protein FWG87_08210 [Defluviitaleaceae bacterium]|nr:hypothetical protein [Defluviitaleaceae bacterium]
MSPRALTACLWWEYRHEPWGHSPFFPTVGCWECRLEALGLTYCGNYCGNIAPKPRQFNFTQQLPVRKVFVGGGFIRPDPRTFVNLGQVTSHKFGAW